MGAASILVVEDTAMLADILRRRLEKEGYAVTVAPSGEAALELLASEASYDVVRLDVLLPRLSGLEVLALIRAEPRHLRLPILMTTEVSAMDDIQRALALGADDYAVQPLELPIVLARIRRHLKRDPKA